MEVIFGVTVESLALCNYSELLFCKESLPQYYGCVCLHHITTRAKANRPGVIDLRVLLTPSPELLCDLKQVTWLLCAADFPFLLMPRGAGTEWEAAHDTGVWEDPGLWPQQLLSSLTVPDGNKAYTLFSLPLLNLRTQKEREKSKGYFMEESRWLGCFCLCFPRTLSGRKSPMDSVTFPKPGTAWFSLLPYKGLDQVPGAELDWTSRLPRAIGNWWKQRMKQETQWPASAI